MKRKQRAHSPSTNRRNHRRPLNLKQLEDRFAILLLLLQHNFDKLLQHKKVR